MPYTPKWRLPRGLCRRVGVISCCSSRATKKALKIKRATSFRKFFPPQLLQVEKGHGRIEWRGIEVREVTPAQMGFPHVAQVARIDRIRELKGGRQEVQTVWIITSLTVAQADMIRLLELARQYWSIENGTHYPLDVSAGEDRCRVHDPVAATVFGILPRAVQGEARAWIRRQPRARDRTCPTFLANMSRRPEQAIASLTRPAGL